MIGEYTSLPYFRLAGLGARCTTATRSEIAAKLWHDWHLGSLKENIAAFSQTVYVAYHAFADDGSMALLLGKLVATDALIPDGAAELWVPPQNYAVFGLPENTLAAAKQMWQQIDGRDDLPKQNQVDFESYPQFGAAKVYVGLAGKVEMMEESIGD